MIQQIQKKIDLLVSNTDKKWTTVETASLESDFKTETALLVTAFEERIKTVVFQLIELR